MSEAKHEFVDDNPYLVYTKQNTLVYSDKADTSIDDVAGGSEMNIGNPVVCMYESYTEPVVDGDASYAMVFNGVSYEDNVICESDIGFSVNSADGAIASGLTLIERIWGQCYLEVL